MHELSIANSLVTAVTEAVAEFPGSAGVGAREGGPTEPTAVVTEVHVQIGALSGVVPAALEFAWDVACSGTQLAGSTLVIRSIPARIHCPACDCESDVVGALVLVCPICGQASGDIRAGRELMLSHIVVQDDPVTVGAHP